MLNVKKGRLLISEPYLNDPVFFKSVILITHHTNNESIGLVLNRSTKIQLNQIIKIIDEQFSREMEQETPSNKRTTQHISLICTCIQIVVFFQTNT